MVTCDNCGKQCQDKGAIFCRKCQPRPFAIATIRYVGPADKPGPYGFMERSKEELNLYDNRRYISRIAAKRDYLFKLGEISSPLSFSDAWINKQFSKIHFAKVVKI